MFSKSAFERVGRSHVETPRSQPENVYTGRHGLRVPRPLDFPPPADSSRPLARSLQNVRSLGTVRLTPRVPPRDPPKESFGPSGERPEAVSEPHHTNGSPHRGWTKKKRPSTPPRYARGRSGPLSSPRSEGALSPSTHPAENQRDSLRALRPANGGIEGRAPPQKRQRPTTVTCGGASRGAPRAGLELRTIRKSGEIRAPERPPVA